MKKLEGFLLKDGVLFTEKRLWAIGITVALFLAGLSIVPAIVKVMTL